MQYHIVLTLPILMKGLTWSTKMFLRTVLNVKLLINLGFSQPRCPETLPCTVLDLPCCSQTASVLSQSFSHYLRIQSFAIKP